MHDETRRMTVEVIYADVDEQRIYTTEVTEPCTVAEAIQQSGVLTDYPLMVLTDAVVGIFSQKVDLATRIQAGDRIEIYRSLQQDPKMRRRKKLSTNKMGN